MALESLTGSAVFIDSLVVTNPLITDQKLQGDDHIRGIKQTLRNTFRNIAASVNASAGELNVLVGATVSAGEVNVLSGVQALTKNQLVYMPSGAAAFAGLSVGAALSVNASAGTVDLDIGKASATASLDSSDEFVLLDASDSTLKKVSFNTMFTGALDMVYLSTQSGAGTATWLTFTNQTSAYQFYRYEFDDVSPVGNSATFICQFGTSASFQTAAYNYMRAQSSTAAPGAGGNVGSNLETAQAQIEMMTLVGATSAVGIDGFAQMYHHASTTLFPRLSWDINGVQTAAIRPAWAAGNGINRNMDTSLSPQIRFGFNNSAGAADAIVRGKIRQYGIKAT